MFADFRHKGFERFDGFGGLGAFQRGGEGIPVRSAYERGLEFVGQCGIIGQMFARRRIVGRQDKLAVALP